MTDRAPWKEIGAGRAESRWWIGPHPFDDPLPLMMVRGREVGPLVVAIAGVHGDEYEGPAAVQACFEVLRERGLNRGAFVGLPVAHPAAWEARSRVSPIDGLDLNRVFPGPGENEPTRKLAAHLFETFIQPAELVVDLHSGGIRMEHLPLAGWYRNAPPQAELFARTFGIGFEPWLIPDTPGVLSFEATRCGKLALGIEWGGGGRLDPTGVVAMRDGLLAVMAALEMMEFEEPPVFQKENPPVKGHYQSLGVSGIFAAAVRLGERVEAGQMLGEVRDAMGEVMDQPRAEWAGRIAALPAVPLIRKGESFVYIG